MKKLTIKDWAGDDRPREKVLLRGITSLSNAELLAILIGSGNNDESAIQLSQRILNTVNNNLYAFGKLSLSELTKRCKWMVVEGIGVAKGVTILAALELGRRRREAEPAVRLQITCSRDVYDLFFPLLADLPHEEFWVAYLNRSNRVIDKVKLSQGGVSETVADIKILLKGALNLLASGMVLCHNHPSGTLRPSSADDQLTRRIQQAAKLLDIQVVDHLILAENRYYSYADEGRLH